jgi:hypothetical protein
MSETMGREVDGGGSGSQFRGNADRRGADGPMAARSDKQTCRVTSGDKISRDDIMFGGRSKLHRAEIKFKDHTHSGANKYELYIV